MAIWFDKFPLDYSLDYAGERAAAIGENPRRSRRDEGRRRGAPHEVD